jgi:Nucleotidyl transferase AbiEii toxin, Type IV TA system
MVNLGIANSRMKDFFDVWNLAQKFEFNGSTLRAAIKATFDRRQTGIAEQPTLALTPEFASETQKQTQWNAFLRKNKLETAGLSFTEIIQALHGSSCRPSKQSLTSDLLHFIGCRRNHGDALECSVCSFQYKSLSLADANRSQCPRGLKVRHTAT